MMLASISIWSDNWIPGIHSSRPTGSSAGTNALARVQELILNPGTWNEGLVQATFSQGDVDAILSIPLSPRSPLDQIVW